MSDSNSLNIFLKKVTERYRTGCGLYPLDETSFQFYLAQVDFDIDNLIQMARDSGFELQYSLAGVEQLEKFLLSTKERGLLKESLIEYAAGYLGEVFIQLQGGLWDLFSKSNQSPLFGLPIITDYNLQQDYFCPYQVILNFLTGSLPRGLRTLFSE